MIFIFLDFMIILLVVQTFKSSYKSFKLFDLHLCIELLKNSTCIFQVCVGLPVQSFLGTTLICLIPFHCFSITCSLTLIASCCFFTDAQADLSLRWAHSQIAGFVMSQLNYATTMVRGIKNGTLHNKTNQCAQRRLRSAWASA